MHYFAGKAFCLYLDLWQLTFKLTPGLVKDFLYGEEDFDYDNYKSKTV
jgi:hypothetical protein